MNYWVFVGMSFSIFFAAASGIARFRKIDPAFYPFIYITWIAAANEILSFCLAYNHLSNTPNNNIYILVEGLLIIWQFKKWNSFSGYKYGFTIASIYFIVTWFIEIHSIAALHQLHFYFQLLQAVVIVILSINMNNRLIISHGKTLVKNPVFIICTGYIIFFTFKILIEAFWLYKIKSSDAFLYAVFFIIACINVLVNLLFLIAVIWIPRKPQYISI